MPRIELIESLFHDALLLPAGDPRRQWLEVHCAGDRDLLDEVSSLLAAETEMAALRTEPPQSG
jgi:hypothetical protein